MNKTVEIILKPSGKTAFVNAGKLTQSLVSSGISFSQDCGGLGICGQCKVRFVKYPPKPSDIDLTILTESQIKNGFRLACSTIVNDGHIIELETERDDRDLKFDKAIKANVLDPWSGNELILAIDMGSTNIVGHLMNAITGELVTSFSTANSQAAFGADVMTRLAYASHGSAEGRNHLKQAVLGDLSTLVKTLEQLKIPISDVVIVMNTAMEVLLLGQNPDNLGKHPYKSQIDGPISLKLFDGECSLGDATFHIPSIIGGYVGSDTVSAIIAIEALAPKTPYVVLDLGTNAEIAAVTEEGVTACSTAAGSAFEGGNISFGMRGIEGAIEKIKITPSKIWCNVIGSGQARGITGSGIFSTIGELLRKDALDYFGVLIKRNLPHGCVAEKGDEKKLLLANGVFITEGDIQQFLLAKASTRAGFDTLMEVCKIDLDTIENVYVCGVFANKISPQDIVSVGLVPVENEKITMAGNAAGTGAAMMACSQKVFNNACDLAEKAVHLQLSGHKLFNQRFTTGVHF
mgnify:CR=1 FL=1|tara:strand:- start:50176 stop:51729 length:1554 start_codon:yes stop_codon:yes gene_type:complete